jgi:hypothetical protein
MYAYDWNTDSDYVLVSNDAIVAVAEYLTLFLKGMCVYHFWIVRVLTLTGRLILLSFVQS